MLARTPQPKNPALAAALEKAIAELGPAPSMQPIPIIGKSSYANAPCMAPRERLGGLHHTPHCMCGWPMGAHK